MNDADLLREAKALIEKPENWIQGAAKLGNAYCMAGALEETAFKQMGSPSAERFADRGQYLKGLELVIRLTRHFAPLRGTLMSRWNDHSDRTHEEVMAKFDEAIAQAEREAAK